MLEDILRDEKIIYVFPYGSKVYGLHNKNSDEDYIVVVESKKDIVYSISKENIDITVYSEPMFKKLIIEHEISVLECIFSKDTHYEFNLDLEKLRRSISAKASNSFVKCKKKIMDGKPYIGKKSLFHSLRILIFGIQIAEYGKIVDFSAANHYYLEIMKYDDWEILKDKFQPIANNLKTKFKKLAPIEKDKYNNKKW